MVVFHLDSVCVRMYKLYEGQRLSVGMGKLITILWALPPGLQEDSMVIVGTISCMTDPNTLLYCMPLQLSLARECRECSNYNHAQLRMYIARDCV